MSVVELWLPILLSAVFVFVVSSVIHMALPIHKGDFRMLPAEADVLASLRTAGLQPGSYAFPFCHSKQDMGSEETLAKFREGPVGFLTVVPNGPPPLGKMLLQWFVYSLLLSVFAGYVGTLALQPGAHYGVVFRVTGTVAILGYATSNISHSIWKGESWVTTAKFVFDGIVYGLVTAGTFGWLWPAAA